jgi:hypothetical protein
MGGLQTCWRSRACCAHRTPARCRACPLSTCLSRTRPDHCSGTAHLPRALHLGHLPEVLCSLFSFPALGPFQGVRSPFPLLVRSPRLFFSLLHVSVLALSLFFLFLSACLLGTWDFPRCPSVPFLPLCLCLAFSRSPALLLFAPNCVRQAFLLRSCHLCFLVVFVPRHSSLDQMWMDIFLFALVVGHEIVIDGKILLQTCFVTDW